MTNIFLFLWLLIPTEEQRESLSTSEKVLVFIIVPRTDSLKIEVCDLSGEKNGFKLIVYKLKGYYAIDDSFYAVGSEKAFDDSTMFCNIKTRKCSIKTIILKPSYAAGRIFGFRLILDSNTQSIFVKDQKTTGAYISIKGEWRQYRRFK